jgi:hypothetical protein
MIDRVAIKYKDTVYVGNDKERHMNVYDRMYDILKEMNQYIDMEYCTDGFLTDEGEFLDRSSAADHAFECGQISCNKPELYSEDLW